jgi:hypothetical protein
MMAIIDRSRIVILQLTKGLTVKLVIIADEIAEAFWN